MEQTIIEPQKVSWLISDNTITVNYEGKTHMLSKTDNGASALIKALKEKDYDALPTLISAAKRIEKFSGGHFTVRDGEILIDGKVAPELLGKKIKAFCDAGLPYQPLVLFAKKLFQNPSRRSVELLYQFLEKNDHPITERGDIIFYKRVNSNFTDCHTGTIDNHPGRVISMPRKNVDSDPDAYCSVGYHCSNYSYAASFNSGQGILLEVNVNPRDVVSIPRDCQGAKLRVCRYKVLAVIEEERTEALRYETKDDDQFDPEDCLSEIAVEDCCY